MKGAIADPSVNTNRAPNITSKIMIGANHHFLRTMRKSQNSKNIESFDIVNPQFLEFNGVNPRLPLSIISTFKQPTKKTEEIEYDQMKLV